MKLSTREIEIMQILWESEEPLTVAEIVERDENGTIDSVQRITKSLIKKNFIAVDGYTQVGKKISRKLKPIADPQKAELPVLKKFIDFLVPKSISASNLVAALVPIEHSKEALDELNMLEQEILKRKEEILKSMEEESNSSEV